MDDATLASGGKVEFSYEGASYRFRAAHEDDHLLGIMRAQKTFYELDVLERIRSLQSWPSEGSLAVDAGAYIGTHSTYFAKVCGIERVLCFEANAESFEFLTQNLRAGNLDGRVTATNKALGAQRGSANLAAADADSNKGSTSIVVAEDNTVGSVVVTTIDEEVGPSAAVSLIKIDVEGAELDVLRGARSVIQRSQPLLCIEVHGGRQLRQTLELLRGNRYQVVDCLGYSPTYVLEPSERGSLRVAFVNWIWLARAYLPENLEILRSPLRRLGRMLSVGRRDQSG